MKLEAQAKAAKDQEKKKNTELEDAKIATKLALDKIPSDESHVDYANAKETWTIKTKIEATKTKEATASKETRQKVEKDVETAKTTEITIKEEVSKAEKKTKDLNTKAAETKAIFESSEKKLEQSKQDSDYMDKVVFF